MSHKVDYSLGNTMSSLSNSRIGEHRATDDLWRILVAPFLLVLNIILILPFPFILLFYPVSLMMSYIFKLLYRLPLAQWMVKVVNSASVTLARRIMKDERDAPFLLIMFGVSPLVLGSFVWQLMLPEFDWRLAILHYVLYFGPGKFNFYFRVFICKHRESHCVKGLYQKPYNRFLDRYFEWFLSIFYGNIPEMDRCGHVGIHHGENNNYPDNQSTLLYDRANLLHFLKYIVHNAYWHNSGVGPLVYFYKNKRWKQFRKMALGVVVYYSIMGVLLWVNWLFALVYFVLPHLLNNALNAAIVSWTWHCFCDPEDPENYYTGSITILNDRDDFMHESYHLSHHINPSLHWTQNYVHYHENQNLYREKKATIFRDVHPIEVFVLTTLLRRFDLLAKKYVDLTNKLSQEEIVELLRQRTRPVKPLTQKNLT